jgi:hypothetical protein
MLIPNSNEGEEQSEACIEPHEAWRELNTSKVHFIWKLLHVVMPAERVRPS